MAHAHISKLDQVHCRSELLARALVCKRSIYIGDMVLKYNGQLRAFKLKPDHVPTSLQGIVDVIPFATCQDYLFAGQSKGTHFHIEEIFAGQHRTQDFDEVELGASSWQPKLDAIQAQIDSLDSTYAQDAEIVAAFATQIAASGDVFTLVTNKVAVETSRATAAEQVIQDDVNANESAAAADRQAVRSEFAAADSILNAAITAEVSRATAAEQAVQADVNANETAAALDRQAVRDEFAAADVILSDATTAEVSRATAAEQAIQADVDANQAVADADRLDIRADYAAADAVIAQAIVDEAALARANEGTNATAIQTEKDRIDAITTLPAAALNNFLAMEVAYQAADGVVSSALSSIITTKVAAAELDTLVAAAPSVAANTAKRSDSDNDVRYYQKSEVDTADNLRVLQTAFDTAIGDRQTTTVADGKYRTIADSYTEAEVDTAVGARVLQSAFDTAIGDRQTTAVADGKYRTIADSYLESEVDSLVGARVLQTAFDTAIGDRQTTTVADGKYRTIADSYTKASVDAGDNLRVLQSAYDTAIADRQTTAVADGKYRTISDSYTEAEVDTAISARVLQTAFDTAIGDRQTTAVADGKYRTIADSYTEAEVDTAVGLRVLQTAHDTAIGDRQTTAVADGKYRTISDSYTKAQTYTQTEADGLFDAKHPALDSISLYHDQSNHRLGLGTTSPEHMVHVHDTSGAAEIKVSRNLADNHITINSGGITKYGNGGGVTAFRLRQVTADPIWIETSNAQAIVIDPTCNVTCKQNVVVEGSLVASKAVPANSGSPGVAGEIRFNADYIFICHATDSWKRVALSAFS